MMNNAHHSERWDRSGSGFVFEREARNNESKLVQVYEAPNYKNGTMHSIDSQLYL